MKLSTSDIIKPTVRRYLTSLQMLLKTAKQYCIENQVNESELLNSRLAEDMHPLIWQIQMVTEFTLRCTARMSEQPVKELAFTEENFDQLTDRIEKVIGGVDAIDNDLLDGSLKRKQLIPLGEKGITLQGYYYLTQFFLPNFFFHVTTTYAILRNAGINIGKQDFVGDITSLAINNSENYGKEQ